MINIPEVSSQVIQMEKRKQKLLEGFCLPLDYPSSYIIITTIIITTAHVSP